MTVWPGNLALLAAVLATGCDGITIATADGGSDGPFGDALQVAPGGGGPCLLDGGIDDQCPAAGLICCAGECVNTVNDPQNCGGCGTLCNAPNGMCHQAACAGPSCAPPCGAGETCCDLTTQPPGPPRCAFGPTCPP